MVICVFSVHSNFETLSTLTGGEPNSLVTSSLFRHPLVRLRSLHGILTAPTLSLISETEPSGRTNQFQKIESHQQALCDHPHGPTHARTAIGGRCACELSSGRRSFLSQLPKAHRIKKPVPSCNGSIYDMEEPPRSAAFQRVSSTVIVPSCARDDAR